MSLKLENDQGTNNDHFTDSQITQQISELSVNDCEPEANPPPKQEDVTEVKTSEIVKNDNLEQKPGRNRSSHGKHGILREIRSQAKSETDTSLAKPVQNIASSSSTDLLAKSGEKDQSDIPENPGGAQYCCGDVDNKRPPEKKTRFAREVEVLYFAKERNMLTLTERTQEPLADENDQQARSYRRRYKSPVDQMYLMEELKRKFFL